MKARIPNMLLTVCTEGQARDRLTDTPGGLPSLDPVGDMAFGYGYEYTGLYEICGGEGLLSY